MAVKYVCQLDKYIPTSSIARPSKIYQNSDFWFENKPSGNPEERLKDFKNLYFKNT
jgi:hypothetical protein